MSDTKRRKDEANTNDLRAVLAALGDPKDDKQWSRMLVHADSEAFKQALALVRHWMTSFTVVSEIGRIFRYRDGQFHCLAQEPQLRCLTDEWLANAKDGEALIPLLATVPGIDPERSFKPEQMLELLFVAGLIPLRKATTEKLKVSSCYWSLPDQGRAAPLGDTKLKPSLGPILVTKSTHKPADTLERELVALAATRTRLLALLSGMDHAPSKANDGAPTSPEKRKKEKKAKKKAKKEKSKKNRSSSSSGSSSEEVEKKKKKKDKKKKADAEEPKKKSNKRKIVAIEEAPAKRDDDMMAEFQAPRVKEAKIAPLATVIPIPPVEPIVVPEPVKSSVKSTAPVATPVVQPPALPISSEKGSKTALTSVERYRALHGWFKVATDDGRRNAVNVF